ncbi:MAG: hypothetical protein QM756_20345 [Polyangiaceae bacterium]
MLFQGALAQQVGGALGLGRSATAAEIGAFAAANAAVYQQIAGTTQTREPLNALRALQFLPPFLNVPEFGGRRQDQRRQRLVDRARVL